MACWFNSIGVLGVNLQAGIETSKTVRLNLNKGIDRHKKGEVVSPADYVTQS